MVVAALAAAEAGTTARPMPRGAEDAAADGAVRFSAREIRALMGLSPVPPLSPDPTNRVAVPSVREESYLLQTAWDAQSADDIRLVELVRSALQVSMFPAKSMYTQASSSPMSAASSYVSTRV